MTVGFAEIEAAAIARHGWAAVEAHLSTPNPPGVLAALGEDRYLAEMTRRIFRAGLEHELVDRKWAAFAEVFAGFDPERCARLSDERIEELLADRRRVRDLPKLRAVRTNARAILDLRTEAGGIGRWVAEWPESEIVGLWEELSRRFQQLGGNSAPHFLRMIGKDTFIPTESVVRALRHWGLFEGEPRTRADRQALQTVFNGWAAETGLPLCRLSQILAMSAD